MTALSIRGLAVDLGGRPVLADTDLDVAHGELVGLIGPNGAGKTTLLRTVLGLLRPRAGQVVIDGATTGRRPGRSPQRRRGSPTARNGLGYVPQRHEFAWDFPISVEHVVMSGRTGHLGLLRRPGVTDWQAVGRALDRVRMTDLSRRPVGELSGGQRQRVLVARALALEPSVLLLDEPFTGLDMPTQELLSDLFVSLAHEGRAVLMTTHDLLAALHTCDRVALLNGRVLAVGTPAELVDPGPWMATFGISETSPLLRLLQVA